MKPLLIAIIIAGAGCGQRQIEPVSWVPNMTNKVIQSNTFLEVGNTQKVINVTNVAAGTITDREWIRHFTYYGTGSPTVIDLHSTNWVMDSMTSVAYVEARAASKATNPPSHFYKALEDERMTFYVGTVIGIKAYIANPSFSYGQIFDVAWKDYTNQQAQAWIKNRATE